MRRGRIWSDASGRPAPAAGATGLTSVQATPPLVLLLSGSTLIASVSDMVGASAGSDGVRGVVTAPLAGYQNRFWRGDGTWQIPSGASLADGNYTGVTVSGSGTVISLNNAVVTLAKMANLSAQGKVIGRKSVGAGVPEEMALGTDIQAYSANLAALAGLTSAFDQLPYFTGSGTAALTTVTGYMRSLLDDGNAATALATLGAAASTHNHAGVYQPADADLTAIAGLISAADRVPYFTGSGTAALGAFTAFGRSLVDDADAAAAQLTLGLVIGTHVQAYDADLTAIAGLTSAADRLPYFTGSGTASLAVFTAFGRSLVDDTNSAAALGTLGAAAASHTHAGVYEPVAARVLTPEQYGGIADGKSHGSGSITSGTNTLTLSGAGDAFVAGDVGKSIVIEGAGTAGSILVTTIAGFTSGTVVTLTANASTTAVAGYVYWGTNNTTPFANMAADLVVGSRVSLAPGMYWTTGPITVATQNVTIAGAGKLATQIVVASTTANCIAWSVTGVGQIVQDLGIVGMGGKMTAGAAIAYTGAAYPYWGSGCRNVYVNRYYDGWVCATTGGTQYEAGNLTIHRPVRYGVYSNVPWALHGGQIWAYADAYVARFSITSGATTVTAGTATFSAHNIGDRIIIAGAISGGTALDTVITAVASSTSCTVANAATATATNANGSIGSRMVTGWYQTNAGTYISNLDIIGGTKSVHLNPGNGEAIFAWIAHNLLCDSAEDIGFQISQSGTGYAHNVKLDGSWIASAGTMYSIAGFTGAGFHVAVSAVDLVEHVTLSGCDVVNNRAYGVYAQQVCGVTVEGCLFENSGTQQLTLTAGRDYAVTGNRFTHDVYGSNNTYCLDMTSAAGAINVTGNLFRGFTSAATNGVTHDGVGVIVANNAVLA